MDYILNVNVVYHVVEVKGAQTLHPLHLLLTTTSSKEVALYTIKNLKKDYPLDVFGIITITTSLEIQ